MREPYIKREKEIAPKEFRRINIRSFVAFFILLVMASTGFYFLYTQPTTADNVQPFLRKNFEMNEAIFSHFYSAGKQSKTFKKDFAVAKVRINGDVGMTDDFNPDTLKIKIVRKPGDTLILSMDEIKALPKTEIVFDFKCVEGWSQVTHWGGVRFSDVLKKYNLAAQSAQQYVGMITPDSTYYVGVDMPSMLQPQTLLCYEMNGKPLPKNQGAPLRLIIPVKYGIKHLKRIGTIFFSNTKPRDYWAEQGYDYYAGL